MAGKKANQEEQEFDLEEGFAKLEEKVALLEQENISLEDSFQAYKEGMEILKQCNDTIDRVEKRVMVINEQGGLNEL